MKLKKDLTSLSDERLMELYARLGDEKAYSELYQRYFQDVAKYTSWLMGDQQRGKDIAQNALIKVFQQPRGFDTSKSFKVWLFSIAKNLWKNELRDEKLRKERHHEIQIELEVLENGMNNGSRLNQIKEALKYLSEDQREVFVLKYSNNLSLNEISEICACSLGTVKSRLFYAMKRMRELVKMEKAK